MSDDGRWWALAGASALAAAGLVRVGSRLRRVGPTPEDPEIHVVLVGHAWNAFVGGDKADPIGSGWFDVEDGYPRKGGSGRGTAVNAAFKHLGFNKVSDKEMRAILERFPADADLVVDRRGGIRSRGRGSPLRRVAPEAGEPEEGPGSPAWVRRKVREALIRLRDKDIEAVKDALRLFKAATPKAKSRFAPGDADLFLEAFPDAEDRQRIRRAVNRLVEDGVYGVDEAIEDLRSALHLGEGSALRRVAPKPEKRRFKKPKPHIIWAPGGKRFGWSERLSASYKGYSDVTPQVGEPPFSTPREDLRWWVVLEMRRSGPEEGFIHAYDLLIDDVKTMARDLYGRDVDVRMGGTWRRSFGRTVMTTAHLFADLGTNPATRASYAWPPLFDRLGSGLRPDEAVRKEWEQFRALVQALENLGFDASYAMPPWLGREPEGSALRRVAPKVEKPKNRIERSAPLSFELRDRRRVPWVEFEVPTARSSWYPKGDAPRPPQIVIDNLNPYPHWREITRDTLTSALDGIKASQEGLDGVFEILLIGWRFAGDRVEPFVRSGSRLLLWREGVLYQATPFRDVSTGRALWSTTGRVDIVRTRFARLETLGDIVLSAEELRQNVDVNRIALGSTLKTPVTLPSPGMFAKEEKLSPKESYTLWTGILAARDADVLGGT